MKTILSLATIALFAATGAALAAGDTALAECVTLSPEHQGARFGSQYLAIRDGDAFYRLEFNGTCGALNSGSVTISTRKQVNQLCATGSLVKSRSGSCQVSGVALIDEDEYERYARRARR